MTTQEHSPIIFLFIISTDGKILTEQWPNGNADLVAMWPDSSMVEVELALTFVGALPMGTILTWRYIVGAKNILFAVTDACQNAQRFKLIGSTQDLNNLNAHSKAALAYLLAICDLLEGELSQEALTRLKAMVPASA